MLSKEVAVNQINLIDLLQLNKKDAMLAIAEKQAAPVKKSHTKAKIAADLANHIQETFLEQVSYFRSTMMDELEQVTAQTEANSISLSQEQLKTLSELESEGFLYIHKKDEEPISISVATELTERISEIKRDQLKQDTIKMNQKLVDYTLALTHLYGVYSTEQLIKIWHTYQDNQLSDETIMEKLTQIVAKQTSVEWNQKVIYDQFFSDEQEAVSFYNQLESRKIPYCMPSEKEVAFYAANTINKQSPHYLNVHHFIQLKSYDIATEENIMAEIIRAAILGTQLEEVYKSLAELGLLFSKEEEVITFVELFQELSNETRKWSYRGWTPDELNALQEKKAPKNVPVTVNKIGRNEPCPCGSGKKYKKCHGK